MNTPEEVWQAIVEMSRGFSLQSRLREQLDVIFQFVEQAFGERNLDAVDQFLGLVEPLKIGHLLTISILRATSRARTKLENWHKLRDCIYLHLEGNQNRTQLMRGLIVENK